MPNRVVVGAQWGDEAKGKIVDCLAESAAMVVRYSGGSNAGHTVMVGEEKFKFFLMPAGILHPHVTCVLADGAVVDPGVLAEEIRDLKRRGIDVSRLRISANAHVIMPYHRLLDELEESRKGEGRLGTTGRGVGPAYVDKAARTGIRVGELIDSNRFRVRITHAINEKNRILSRLYDAPPLNLDEVLAECEEQAKDIRPFVTHTAPLVAEAAASEPGVLFEGAQGTLLDIDHGTYPFVTSSHPVAGGACIGTGVGPTAIHQVIGVSKAYTTRVGAGVFPTEQCNEIGDHIRERGAEYGTTTGRPRRCGWLDTVILRYSAMVNGLSSLALNHLDVLSGLDEVKIAVAYRIDGAETSFLPGDLSNCNEIEPVYETLPGWDEEIGQCESLASLPRNARRYVERVEQLAGIPIFSVSVGPVRDQTIFLQK